MHAQAGQYRKSAAQSAVESVQAQLQNAESELVAAKSRLSYTQVVAPISGVVSVLVARQGEIVGPSAPVATIIDPQSTWVRVGIPETYADHIAVGEKLQIQFPSGQIVEGTVLTKGVEGDFATQYDLNQLSRDIRCVAIKISVANPELTITPGMTAKVLLSPAELKAQGDLSRKIGGRIRMAKHIEAGISAIAVEGVSKKFGDFTAVDNVSFCVDTGETFGLLGPNGAGKSTLIRMMTTLLPITSGRIKVFNQDVALFPNRARLEIGVIPQAMTSDTELTVQENLSIYAKLYGVKRDERQRAIKELLEIVGLTEMARL